MRVLLLVILVLSCTLGSAQQVKRTLIPLGLTRALQNVEGDPLVHLYLKGDLDDISTWVRSHRGVVKKEVKGYLSVALPASELEELESISSLQHIHSMPEAIIRLIEGGRLRLSLDSSLVSSVTWFQNGAELIGESQLEWSPTEMGVYSATFTDSNGCEHASNSLNVYALGRTSMVDFDVRVFPQPFSDQLNLIGVEAFQRLELHNVSGRLIRSLPIRGDKISVLTSDIAPGLYTLRLVSSEGSGLVRQVIK